MKLIFLLIFYSSLLCDVMLLLHLAKNRSQNHMSILITNSRINSSISILTLYERRIYRNSYRIHKIDQQAIFELKKNIWILILSARSSSSIFHLNFDIHKSYTLDGLSHSAPDIKCLCYFFFLFKFGYCSINFFILKHLSEE